MATQYHVHRLRKAKARSEAPLCVYKAREYCVFSSPHFHQPTLLTLEAIAAQSSSVLDPNRQLISRTMSKPAIFFVTLALVAASCVSAFSPQSSPHAYPQSSPHAYPKGTKDEGKCGDRCGGYYGDCAYGLKCEYGYGEYGICKKYQPLGWSCAKDCEVCEEPYFCEHGYCKAKELKCGQACSYDGDGRCGKGTFCNGDRCVAVKRAGVGEYCDSCYTCKHGLKCEWYHGKRQCRKYYY